MAKDNKTWSVRHKVLTAILIIAVLGTIGSMSGGGNKSTTMSTNKNQPVTNNENKASDMVKLNEVARDGKFEFIVKNFECGLVSVGVNQYASKTAQGQYCLLNVTVKNIGNEKQSLFSANQKLLKDSTEYSADDMATFYAAPEGSSWYSDINPGNSVEGRIVFDVPKDVTPTIAELHDSPFSNGVKINLQ